ncbi:MAG: hypothetical protein WC897_04275 [Candidatus Gracilibacteria bacterium]
MRLNDLPLFGALAFGATQPACRDAVVGNASLSDGSVCDDCEPLDPSDTGLGDTGDTENPDTSEDTADSGDQNDLDGAIDVTAGYCAGIMRNEFPLDTNARLAVPSVEILGLNVTAQSYFSGEPSGSIFVCFDRLYCEDPNQNRTECEVDGDEFADSHSYLYDHNEVIATATYSRLRYGDVVTAYYFTVDANGRVSRLGDRDGDNDASETVTENSPH